MNDFLEEKLLNVNVMSLTCTSRKLASVSTSLGGFFQEKEKKTFSVQGYCIGFPGAPARPLLGSLGSWPPQGNFIFFQGSLKIYQQIKYGCFNYKLGWATKNLFCHILISQKQKIKNELLVKLYRYWPYIVFADASRSSSLKQYTVSFFLRNSPRQYTA